MRLTPRRRQSESDEPFPDYGHGVKVRAAGGGRPMRRLVLPLKEHETSHMGEDGIEVLTVTIPGLRKGAAA